MGADQNTDWTMAAASALEWWHDAGVDFLVEDATCDWFAAPPPPAQPAAHVTPAAVAAAAVASALPDTLEAFSAWRVSDAAVEHGWGNPMFPPATLHNPPLMVLVDMPEADDTPETGLVGGAVGRLLDAMLRAIGRSRDDTAIAALAVARPLAGRLPAGAVAEFERLARHHVALVQPARLLLLGREACCAFLGGDAARSGLRTLNHQGIACPTIASFHPRFLLATPQAKGEAWRDLQMLVRETDT